RKAVTLPRLKTIFGWNPAKKYEVKVVGRVGAPGVKAITDAIVSAKAASALARINEAVVSKHKAVVTIHIYPDDNVVLANVDPKESEGAGAAGRPSGTRAH